LPRRLLEGFDGSGVAAAPSFNNLWWQRLTRGPQQMHNLKLRRNLTLLALDAAG
jgi:hypothetical protein